MIKYYECESWTDGKDDTFCLLARVDYKDKEWSEQKCVARSAVLMLAQYIDGLYLLGDQVESLNCSVEEYAECFGAELKGGTIINVSTNKTGGFKSGQATQYPFEVGRKRINYGAGETARYDNECIRTGNNS